MVGLDEPVSMRAYVLVAMCLDSMNKLLVPGA